MALKPKFTDIPNISGASFTDADGTNKKDIFTPGANGARVEAIVIVTTEIVVNDVLLFIYDGANDLPIGHIDVPVGSGTDGTVNAVDALNATNLPFIQKDVNGNSYINLKNGYKIKAAMLTAVASGKQLDISAIGSDY